MDIADMVLEDMTTRKIKASNFTIGILVKMYARRRELDKAFEVVEQFPAKHGITLNAQAHTCLMRACINNNDLDRAFQVFYEMKASGQEVDAKAYSALISGSVRQGHIDKAVKIAGEACNSESRGCYPPTRRLLEAEPL